MLRTSEALEERIVLFNATNAMVRSIPSGVLWEYGDFCRTLRIQYLMDAVIRGMMERAGIRESTW